MRHRAGAEGSFRLHFALVASQPAVGGGAEEDADKPAEVRHFMQGRNKADNQPQAHRRQQGGNRFRVKAVAVSIFTLRRIVKQIVH